MNVPAKLRVAAHVHWRRFDSELVILDLESGQYYGLNEVAAVAFERVARGEDVAQTVSAILELYDVKRETLETDIEKTFVDLLDRGVLQPATG